MKKTTNTSTRRATKSPSITNSRRVLNELNKLQKYKNGVKYHDLSDFTGHLLFRDVIAIVNRLAGTTTTTTASTRRRKK